MEMAVHKFAFQVVKKFLKYGMASQKALIIKNMQGETLRLLKRKESAGLVEYVYTDVANASQRRHMVAELYGPTFALFQSAECRSLAEICQDGAKCASIMSHLRQNLVQLLNKEMVGQSIVHRALLDFFTHAQCSLREEMIESCREVLIYLLHTHDGSRVAMQCVWHGNAKDRKVIVKSLKDHVTKAACEEFGHLVLLTIFDSVDDTKLVEKVIIKEVLADLSTLSASQYGRKVLFYLMAPRHPAFFHPDIIRLLERGDGNLNSKKDVVVRRAELLRSLSPEILNFVQANVETLLFDPPQTLVLLAILKHVPGDVVPCFSALCSILLNAGNNRRMLDDNAAHLVFKRLLLADRERRPHGPYFSLALLTVSAAERLLSEWLETNRGCFLLLVMLEGDVGDVRRELTGVISNRRVMTLLNRSTHKGAQLLLQKLRGL